MLSSGGTGCPKVGGTQGTKVEGVVGRGMCKGRAGREGRRGLQSRYKVDKK